jgi:hypothetical protein
MSVNDSGRLDMYQWLFFLAQHARRHLAQIAANQAAWRVATKRIETGPQVRRHGVTTFNVRNVGPEDRSEWLQMRRALWDDCPDEQQDREMERIPASDSAEVLFAERPECGLWGFLLLSWTGEPRTSGYAGLSWLCCVTWHDRTPDQWQAGEQPG